MEFLYELHRGAVVVFAGELAEADVGDAEFGGHEGATHSSILGLPLWLSR